MSDIASVLKVAKSIETKVDSQDTRIAAVEKSINSPDFKRDRLPAETINHKVEGQYGFKSFGHYAHEVRVASGKGGGETMGRIREQITKAFGPFY